MKNQRPHNSFCLLCAALLIGVSAARAQSGGKPKLAAAAPAAPAASPGEDQELAPPADKGTNPNVGDVSGETQTEILSMGGLDFNSKTHVAIFTQDVRVTDPRFQLSCDKLTVYLRSKGSSSKAAPSAAKGGGTPSPLAAPAPTSGAGGGPDFGGDSSSNGGIDHAIAEGHVIIVQDRPAAPGQEAKRSVGTGARAEFDNNTGNMVLRGMPTITQNTNSHVATSPSTYMILRRDNSLTTIGPQRTLIIQRKGADALTGGGGGGAAAASPAPEASPAKPRRPR